MLIFGSDNEMPVDLQKYIVVVKIESRSNLVYILHTRKIVTATKHGLTLS